MFENKLQKKIKRKITTGGWGGGNSSKFVKYILYFGDFLNTWRQLINLHANP